MAHRNLQIVLKRNIAKIMQSKTPSPTMNDIMQALKEVRRTQTSIQEDLRHVRAGQSSTMARLNTNQTQKLPLNPIQYAENSVTTSNTTNKPLGIALADMKEAEEDASEQTRCTESERDRQTGLTKKDVAS